MLIENSRKEEEMNTIVKYSVKDIMNNMLAGMFVRKYRQFKQVDPKGFIAIQCPNCNETFGLTAEYVEKIGETAYLHPYVCPYCSNSYTLKND